MPSSVMRTTARSWSIIASRSCRTRPVPIAAPITRHQQQPDRVGFADVVVAQQVYAGAIASLHHYVGRPMDRGDGSTQHRTNGRLERPATADGPTWQEHGPAGNCSSAEPEHAGGSGARRPPMKRSAFTAIMLFACGACLAGGIRVGPRTHMFGGPTVRYPPDNSAASPPELSQQNGLRTQLGLCGRTASGR